MINSNYKNTSNVVRLYHFLLLFQINKFVIVEESVEFIRAQIGWNNDNAKSPNDEIEGYQDIEWAIQNLPNLDDALLVANFLRDRNLIDTDRIILSEDELFLRINDELNWDRSRYDRSLKTLFELRVDILDAGRKTDFFFVHF